MNFNKNLQKKGKNSVAILRRPLENQENYTTTRHATSTLT